MNVIISVACISSYLGWPIWFLVLAGLWMSVMLTRCQDPRTLSHICRNMWQRKSDAELALILIVVNMWKQYYGYCKGQKQLTTYISKSNIIPIYITNLNIYPKLIEGVVATPCKHFFKRIHQHGYSLLSGKIASLTEPFVKAGGTPSNF